MFLYQRHIPVYPSLKCHFHGDRQRTDVNRQTPSAAAVAASVQLLLKLL